MESSSACATDNDLAALAEGALHGPQKLALEEHVSQCVSCRRLWTELLYGQVQSRAEGRPQATWPVGSGPSELSTELRPGALVGRYVLDTLIGRGGMGEVFSGYDPELDRRIAIKLVPLANQSSTADGLLGEARLMAKVHHQHVVQVHDAGRFSAGIYIVMQLIAGNNLATWSAQARQAGQWQTILRVLCQAGQGLATIHGNGLVHQDFKPSNVLCDENGHPYVADFGLSKLLRRSAAAVQAVPQGGTPAYAAPEILEGQPATARSDQYSFCVTLWECLTGDRPTTASQLENGPIGSKRVVAVVRRGLHPDPQQRYSSLEELLFDLQKTFHRPRKRYWLVAGLGIVGIAALIPWKDDSAASPTQLCKQGAQRIHKEWNLLDSSARQTAASSIPLAQSALAALRQHVSDYQKHWANAYETVCLQSYERGSDSAWLDRRMACLEDRSRNLVTLLQGLGSAPQNASLHTALERALDLPSVAACQTLPAGDAKTGQPAVYRTEAIASLLQLAKNASENEDLAAEARWQAVFNAALRSDDKEAELQSSHALFLIALQNRDDLRGAQTLEPRLQLDAEASGRADVEGRVLWLRAQLRMAEAAFAEAVTLLDQSRARFQEASNVGELEPLVVADALAKVSLTQAQVLILTKDIPGASAMLERAKESMAKVYPPGHPQWATIANLQGLVLDEKGDYQAAIELYRQTLAEIETAVGPNGLTLPLQNNLGLALRKLGRFDEAQVVLRRAYDSALSQGAAQEGHRAVLATTLAQAYISSGQPKSAMPLLTDAISIQQKHSGPKSPALASSYNTLGTLALEQGQNELARTSFERALAAGETLGLTDSSLAAPLTNLGELALGEGNWQLAYERCQRAFDIDRTTLPAKHPDLAYSLTCLAAAELGRGQGQAARLHAEKAFSFRKDCTDIDPIECAKTALVYAQTIARSKPAQSRALKQEARRLVQNVSSKMAEQLSLWPSDIHRMPVGLAKEQQ